MATRDHEEACVPPHPAPRCWPAGLSAAQGAPRCGARAKRTGQPCQSPAMPNGRCHKHGGASTDPRTAEGLARCRRASWKHGKRAADARAAARLRAQARALAAGLLRVAAEGETDG